MLKEHTIGVGDHRSLHCGSFDGEFGTLRHATRTLEREGYLLTENTSRKPIRHRMIGCGVGHDDARFAETGSSYAAYLENPPAGDPFERHWAVDERSRRTMFDRLYREGGEQ